MKEERQDSFVSSVVSMNGDVWSVGAEVPMEVALKYKGSGYKRVVCTLNNQEKYQCALMHAGQGRYFVNVNAQLQKKLSLSVGDEVQVSIVPDKSKYGLPMPEELQAIFDMDAEGDKVFHTLTPGKQRTLLHLVGKPKSSEIRIKKAMVVVDYLKEVNGKLDFKQLNEAFKRANQK